MSIPGLLQDLQTANVYNITWTMIQERETNTEPAYKSKLIT